MNVAIGASIATSIIDASPRLNNETRERGERREYERTSTGGKVRRLERHGEVMVA
jgi:hypothetical protein